MNRLTNATAPAPIPNQPAGGSGTLAYGYDWVGNRIHPPSGANPMVYNKADQLTSWPGMRQYRYYGDGSLHHVLNAGGTSTLASYIYTPTGLLATASYGDTRTLTNTWDASQQRVGMSVEGHDYEFVYDTTAGIPAVIEEVNAGSTSTTTAYYFREPGGALISRVEGANTSYYHFDALGSTRLLTDVSENVTDKYAYDAYGSLISHDHTANSVDQPYQYVGQLGYYTHYMEPDFGLLQLGVRFYDPEVGRFGQRDALPISGYAVYAYAMGTPESVVDPTGMVAMAPARGCAIAPAAAKQKKTNQCDPTCFNCTGCEEQYDKQDCPKVCKKTTKGGRAYAYCLGICTGAMQACGIAYCNDSTDMNGFLKCAKGVIYAIEHGKKIPKP